MTLTEWLALLAVTLQAVALIIQIQDRPRGRHRK